MKKVLCLFSVSFIMPLYAMDAGQVISNGRSINNGEVFLILERIIDNRLPYVDALLDQWYTIQAGFFSEYSQDKIVTDSVAEALVGELQTLSNIKLSCTKLHGYTGDVLTFEAKKESLCIIKKAKQDRYDWFNRSCIAIVSPRLGITPTKAQASLEYIFQTGWFQNCDMNTEPSLQQLVIPVIKQFRFCQDFNSIPNPIIEKMTLFFLPKLIHLSFKNECSTAAIFYKNDAQWLKKLGYVLEKNVIDNSFILSKHESVQEHE